MGKELRSGASSQTGCKPTGEVLFDYSRNRILGHSEISSRLTRKSKVKVFITAWSIEKREF